MMRMRDERFSAADDPAISRSAGSCAGAAATQAIIEAARARMRGERIRIVVAMPKSMLKYAIANYPSKSKEKEGRTESEAECLALIRHTVSSWAIRWAMAGWICPGLPKVNKNPISDLEIGLPRARMLGCMERRPDLQPNVMPTDHSA
jgi:hypothetical protein